MSDCSPEGQLQSDPMTEHYLAGKGPTYITTLSNGAIILKTILLPILDMRDNKLQSLRQSFHIHVLFSLQLQCIYTWKQRTVLPINM